MLDAENEMIQRDSIGERERLNKHIQKYTLKGGLRGSDTAKRAANNLQNSQPHPGRESRGSNNMGPSGWVWN